MRIYEIALFENRIIRVYSTIHTKRNSLVEAKSNAKLLFFGNAVQSVAASNANLQACCLKLYVPA